VKRPLERILVAVANIQSGSEKKANKRIANHLVEDWSVEQVSVSTAIERGSVGFEPSGNDH